MLRSHNATQLRGNEVVYVMEISLKQSYHKIQQLISNFSYASGSDFKQPIQKKLNQNKMNKYASDDPQDLGFVFVDVHRKVIYKWVKRCQVVLRKYELDNGLCVDPRAAVI